MRSQDLRQVLGPPTVKSTLQRSFDLYQPSLLQWSSNRHYILDRLLGSSSFLEHFLFEPVDISNYTQMTRFGFAFNLTNSPMLHPTPALEGLAAREGDTRCVHSMRKPATAMNRIICQ